MKVAITRDIEMFKILGEKCKEEELRIIDFWKNDRWLSPEHKIVLAHVKKEINWKGTKNELLKRIRRQARILGFSARDVKLITKMINQQKRNGYRDFEALVYYFPGKTAEMIQEKYKETHPDEKKENQ
jgi:hypothetical protein